MEGRVLAVGPATEQAWTAELETDGFSVDVVSTTDAAVSAVETGGIACVVVDEWAESGRARDPLDDLAAVRTAGYDGPVVLTSESPDGDLAAAATRLGVSEYYPRSTTEASLAERVRANVLQKRTVGDSDGTQPRDTGVVRGRDLPRLETGVGTGAETAVAALDAVGDGVYVVDSEGQFVVVNDALAEMAGYAPSELVGEEISTITDAESPERVLEAAEPLVEGDATAMTIEKRVLPRDGEPFPAEDHAAVVTEDGEFAGLAGVIRDVTDRKEREDELRRARERVAELLESSRALLGAHSRERVAEVVVDAVAEALGYDLNVVRLYDSERECLEAVAGSGSGAVAVESRPQYAVGEGGPGRAFETGEILRAPEDFESGPEDLPGPIVETLYVPLGDHGTVSIGATDRDTFDDSDRSLAEILASNAAVALDRIAYEEDLVQYRTVLENVQDMVYVADEAGRFTLVTDPLAEWLDEDPTALVGTPVASVLASDATGQWAVGDRQRCSDGNRTVETTFETGSGATLPGEIEVSPLPADSEAAGTVGVVRDRSELVKTREQLESQRDRFTYLFDNLPDPVVDVWFDPEDGPIVSNINDAFADVFGYDAEEITGEPLNDFVLPVDERESGRELDRLAAAGETVQREVRRKTADGYRDFLFRGVPYDTTDDGTSSFGIYTEITEQKERERRLNVFNRVLRHNLRNDLNLVMGYADMIADRTDDESIRELAETLIDAASEMATLSDRARSLDRTIRQESLRDHTVDIGSVVESVTTDYRTEHPDATIETRVTDAAVVGDDRIELALAELLDNSIEHGGEKVHVRLSVDREDDRVAVRVADDGPGIPANERVAVGEEADITQLEHGSGLGLWVVRWVCESCGGRLRFEESDLGGSAAVLWLTPADDQ